MERLLIAVTLTLFITQYVGLACLAFVGMLFSGLAPVNYKTLSACTALVMYYLYGLVGMFVVTVSSLSLVGSAAMYWFDMSVDDVKAKLKEISEEESTDKKTDEKTSNVSESQLNTKLQELSEMKSKTFQTLYEKTGLTEEKVQLYKGYYQLACTKFDSFYDLVYYYLLQFRGATNDITGLKDLYTAYDKICSFGNTIDSFKNLHKLSRSVQLPSPNADVNSGIGTSSNDPFSMLGGMDMNSIMKMNEQMERQFGNMSPQQKQQMNDMAQQMLGGIDMSQMMNMFGGSNGSTRNNDTSNIRRRG